MAKVLLSLHRSTEAREACNRAIVIREKMVPVDALTGQRPFNKDLEAARGLLTSIEAAIAKKQGKKSALDVSREGDSSFRGTPAGKSRASGVLDASREGDTSDRETRKSIRVSAVSGERGDVSNR